MAERDLSAYLPPQKKSLTDQEKSEIKEFKNRPQVQQYLKKHHHDFYLNRWLTACRRDIAKATEMFVNSMVWREQVGADTILETFPKSEVYSKLINYWPGSIHNMEPYTYDGSIVLYEALGRADPKMIDRIGMDNIIQFHIYGMEKLQKVYFDITEKKGFFPGFVVIQDLGDVGWNSCSQTVLKALQTTVSINQNNYPDTLRKMYIINTPTAVNMIWKACKLWFDPRTLAKFEFINGEDVYRETFANIIPAKSLPKRLGGTSDVDIPLGGPMEEKKTGKNSKNKLVIDIGRGASHTKMASAEVSDVFNWEFKTKDYDISFAVYLQNKDTKEEIVPLTRVDSHKKPVSGTLVVEKAGVYEFFWDNTYSWTKGKTLKLRLTKNSVLVV